MSGEVRLSEAERNEVVFRFYDASTSEEAIETVERIIAARLAAVPVPSEPGLAAAVEALADEWERDAGAFAASGLRWPPLTFAGAAARLRALLSERTATTGGGGS